MANTDLHTTEQWIDLIANSELPAITCTTKMLDKFSADDKSSLAKLSEAVLHDQALSSCLLKVANYSHHFSVNKVTTVSRATVVLGVRAVKNICLTSKLVSNLLKSKSLDVNVYEKLTQLMANSFYAGMLAKMMVPDYSEKLQEEVYLAAMLYRIGEAAFWSVGGDITKKIADYDANSPNDFTKYCQKELGTNFTDLSKGLAKNWSLSNLLIKSLDNPTTSSYEVKVIHFADQLSDIISKPEGRSKDYNHLLKDISGIIGISVKELTAKIDSTHALSEKLLSSYGAEVLVDRVRCLPSRSDFDGQSIKVDSPMDIVRDRALLDGFMKLTTLMQHSRDFNEYLQLALENIATTFGFDRSSFLMLVNNKTQVSSRLVLTKSGSADMFKINIDLKQSENVIARVINTDTPALINNQQGIRWCELITPEVSKVITDGAVAFVPVKIGGKAIGVICLQLFRPKNKIELSEFKQVCSFIDHLNMCLTMIKYG